ncbi:MAG: hypothetical protein OSA89_13930 [Mariniblastus sp.]|nr:hypothetical protein [Mariniblastus sp.]
MLRSLTVIASLTLVIAVLNVPQRAAANNTEANLSLAACPFCSAVAMTFSDQLNSNDIAVVAKLVEIPPPNDDPNADFPKAKFVIEQVLKGKKFVGDSMTFKTQLVGNYPLGQKFLVMGVDPPKVSWTTPMKASERVFKYLSDIQALPEKGPERLVFFQNYFEDKESVLAFDAYDEFAQAPYEDLIAMKDQMDREKLIGWIKNPETSVSRRRLYFTMLGVCGKPEDTQLLEELINSGSRKKRAGLDALIACYLTLKGEAGVDLIETTFLEDQEVDYVDTLAAVSALRFHGTEVDLIPKKRIVIAIRHLLDRPKMADMIIPDLARWKDWSVMERLVQMFKDADSDSNWLRVPVITYLRACPKPEAKEYIEELRKIDPESVQRADFFLGVGDSDDDWDNDESEETEKPPAVEPEKKTDEPSKADAPISNLPKNTSASQVVRKIPLPQEPAKTRIGQTFATPADALATEFDYTRTGTTETQTMAIALSEDIKLVKTAAPPNPPREAFVTQGQDVASSSLEPAPVAAVVAPNLTWQILLIPLAFSVAIFVLLWTVVNGWFERLIF